MTPSQRKPLRWRTALPCAALALWSPFVVTVALNHQVRRFWEDIWFWPGAVPAIYLVDDHYGEHYIYFAVGNLAIWTLIARRWPRVGVAGALVHGTYMALYLCAMAAV
jgi:hypothetical protein